MRERPYRRTSGNGSENGAARSEYETQGAARVGIQVIQAIRALPACRALPSMVCALALAGHAAAATPSLEPGTAAGAAAGQPSPPPPAAASPAPARPRIGLVLSGGGARGGAHIGVLRVLRDIRVPVDVVVGTSAGAIVGAAFASGMPLAEIEALMGSIDTASLLRDRVRAELPFRRKADDAINFVGPEVGVGADGVSLPKGVVSGVALEGVLRSMTRLQTDEDFDRLPVRFRAVATDVTTGEMVVIGRGNLTDAIRASMAVPGAVNPVEIDGRLLVDGGVVRNLPVDVARSLGADVVIAVNIGTPLRGRDELKTILGVSDQLTRILTVSNVNRSLAELGANDLLITPDLGTVSTADFDRLREAAQAGETAALALSARLGRLGLDEPTYAATQNRPGAGRPSDEGRRLAAVRIEGTERVNPQVVLAAMQSRAGEPVSVATIEADMKRIYGTGDFEGVGYRIEETPQGPVLLTRVAEKTWGPSYLRFGLAMSYDFAGPPTFDINASHRSTWLNDWGGEWRSDVQFGRTDRLRTEWHQPLSPAQRLFASASFETMRRPFDVFGDEGRVLSTLRRVSTVGSADLGLPLGSNGELRLSAQRGSVRLRDSGGFPLGGVLGPSSDLSGVAIRLRSDTLDSLRFPRQGQAFDLEAYRSLPAWGASDAYEKFTASWRGAWSSGNHTVRAALERATAGAADRLPIYELYSLGGFLRLSGYRTGEFVGRELGFGRLIYNWRIASPGLFDGVFVGASLEAGRVGNEIGTLNTSETRQGRSLYLAADSPLGPIHLAYGRGSRDRQAIYFFIGQP